MTASTHISTSGGLISSAFIENIREPGSRQGGVEPESFDLPWSAAPGSPAAMEETVAKAWELLLERWDAVRAGLPAMDVSQPRRSLGAAPLCVGRGAARPSADRVGRAVRAPVRADAGRAGVRAGNVSDRAAEG
jgi:hypothetical protein